MTDHRCPKCDRPVSCRQEVTLGKPTKPKTQCPSCKTPIRLSLSSDEDTGDCWYYIESKVTN